MNHLFPNVYFKMKIKTKGFWKSCQCCVEIIFGKTSLPEKSSFP